MICDAVQVLGYISFSPNRDYLFVDAVAVLPDSIARAWVPSCWHSQRRRPCAWACEV